jgi:2-polyprenyl-3-methyl-5-hydroxy-6-metoxy-1,4-benzoquinol methylase
MYKCRVCGKPFESELYKAHEVRFGWDDEFDYVHCPHCNSVYIKEIPDDLGRYYSSEYYSLQDRNESFENSFFRRTARKYLLKYRINGKNPIGKIIALKEKEAFQWIEQGMLDFHSSILDVGCGTGRTILKLANSGFTSVQGIDPFLDHDIVYHVGKQEVRIWKKDIQEVEEKYDVITLTNVMEHMTDPHIAFKSFAKCMHNNSILMMYLPVMSDFSWSHYGIKAHQFSDVPRHLFIYSVDALRTVAAQYNLSMFKCKPSFYYKILYDVYGNMASDIQKMDQPKLIQELVDKNDAGHIFAYFKLIE